MRPMSVFVLKISVAELQIFLFRTVSFPLILPGMAPSICAPGQLIWSVVSWKQENFRAQPPLPSSCGKRRRCVLINATLRHSYPLLLQRILIQRIFLHAVNFCGQRRRFFSAAVLPATEPACAGHQQAGHLPALYDLRQSAPFRLCDGFHLPLPTPAARQRARREWFPQCFGQLTRQNHVAGFA